MLIKMGQEIRDIPTIQFMRFGMTKLHVTSVNILLLQKEIVMMDLDGKSCLLDYVLNQLSYSKLIDKIIVATTKLQEDEIIVNHVQKKGYRNIAIAFSFVLNESPSTDNQIQ